MNIGQMDRQITLQAHVPTQAPNGEEVSTWADVATVWAEKKYDRGGETYQAEQKTAVQKVTYRIRWRAGVTSLLRLLDTSDNQVYQVDAVAEIGRKQGLLLSSFSRGEEAGEPAAPLESATYLSATAS